MELKFKYGTVIVKRVQTIAMKEPKYLVFDYNHKTPKTKTYATLEKAVKYAESL